MPTASLPHVVGYADRGGQDLFRQGVMGLEYPLNVWAYRTFSSPGQMNYFAHGPGVVRRAPCLTRGDAAISSGDY